jgi:hypothetical protein
MGRIRKAVMTSKAQASAVGALEMAAAVLAHENRPAARMMDAASLLRRSFDTIKANPSLKAKVADLLREADAILREADCTPIQCEICGRWTCSPVAVSNGAGSERESVNVCEVCAH